MPPKRRFSCEQFVEAGLAIVREEGFRTITARSIGAKLNISAPAVFTYYSGMDELQKAILDGAKKIYDRYAETGLAMNPPFKGFGIMSVRFAIEEPALYQLLFMSKAEGRTLDTYLEEEGHREQIIAAIMNTFSLTERQAHTLYRQMNIYCMGMCAMASAGSIRFEESEIAQLLGSAVRGLVMGVRAPEDDRTAFIPQMDRGPEGGIEEYLEGPSGKE